MRASPRHPGNLRKNIMKTAKSRGKFYRNWLRPSDPGGIASARDTDGVYTPSPLTTSPWSVRWSQPRSAARRSVLLSLPGGPSLMLRKPPVSRSGGTACTVVTARRSILPCGTILCPWSNPSTCLVLLVTPARRRPPAMMRSARPCSRSPSGSVSVSPHVLSCVGLSAHPCSPHQCLHSVWIVPARPQRWHHRTTSQAWF